MNIKQWIIIIVIILGIWWYIEPNNFSEFTDSVQDTVTEKIQDVTGQDALTKMEFVCESSKHCNDSIDACDGQCLCAEVGDCVIPKVKNG